MTAVSKATHLRRGRHSIVIKVTLDANGNSMAQSLQLASWKECELSFLEELFSQTKVELKSKWSGGHYYFHTKNNLGCLEQVCVAPPSLGHLYCCCWYPILVTVTYREITLCIMKVCGLKHFCLATRAQTPSFPLSSVDAGSGLFHLELLGPHLTSHHSSEKVKFLSPSVY